jgi:hypothetical protein
MSGRLLTPSEYFSNLVFSAWRRATSGEGRLDTPNKPETTAFVVRAVEVPDDKCRKLSSYKKQWKLETTRQINKLKNNF